MIRWEDEFLGVNARTWTILLILLVLSPLVGFLVRKVITWLFKTRYRLAHMPVPEWHWKGMRRATALLVAVLIWRYVIPYLELPDKAISVLLTAIDLISIAAAMWLLNSLWEAAAHIIAERTGRFDGRAERLLVPVTRKLVKALIFIAGLVAALAAFHVNVAGVLAGLGIGGLLIALAAKDSVENVFGSFTILFDMPFALGDQVKIGSVEGVVEEINLRSTRIRTFEDSVVTLPNSNLIRASVENFGARRVRRQRFYIRLAHDAPPEGVEELCAGIRSWLQRHSRVEGNRVRVAINEITEAWIGVLVECFFEVGNIDEELRLREQLLATIIKQVREKGLRFSGTPAPPTPPASTEPDTMDLKARAAASAPTPVIE